MAKIRSAFIKLVALALLLFVTAIAINFANALTIADKTKVTEPLQRGNTGDKPPYKYVGQVHFHTTYSDGGKSMEKVIAMAGSMGFDFAIPSDHNTLKPIEDGWGRYSKGLLVIPTVEHSMGDGRGHYLSLGDNVDRVRSSTMDAEEVYEYNRSRGNMIFLSHIYNPTQNSWKDWTKTGFAGIEGFNFDESWRKYYSPLGVPKVLGTLAAYKVEANSINGLVVFPEKTLAKFDELIKKGDYAMIGASDAHGKKIFGERGGSIPSYTSTFDVVQTVIVTRERLNGDYYNDRNLVLNALKNGNSYISFFGGESVKEFDFTISSGSKTAIPGEKIKLRDGATLSIELPSPSMTSIQLIKDGVVVNEWSDKGQVSQKITEPGSYRVQVVKKINLLPLYTESEFPLFLSNPIHLEG